MFDDGITYMKQTSTPESIDVDHRRFDRPGRPGRRPVQPRLLRKLPERAAPGRPAGAAERIAAGAHGADQGHAQRHDERRLHALPHAALPAALLPDRLVELHHGAQGTATSTRSASAMPQPSRSTPATTTPTSTRARWRCRRSWRAAGNCPRASSSANDARRSPTPRARRRPVRRCGCAPRGRVRRRRSCRRRSCRCWPPCWIASTTRSTWSSVTATSSLILGRKSTTYSAPR